MTDSIIILTFNPILSLSSPEALLDTVSYSRIMSAVAAKYDQSSIKKDWQFLVVIFRV